MQDRDGRCIPGLYAAGACAWNIAQDTRSYSSGTCLGESTYFGRRAGRHAARRMGTFSISRQGGACDTTRSLEMENVPINDAQRKR